MTEESVLDSAYRRAGEAHRLYDAMTDAELAHAIAFGFVSLMHRSDSATRWVNEAITEMMRASEIAMRRIHGGTH